MGNSRFDLTVFLHIPKAGGTTLRSVISRQYSKREVIDVPPLILTPKLNLKVVQEHLSKCSDVSRLSHSSQDIKIIRGHLVFGVHQIFNKPVTYMTILRHPISKIISTYYYMLKAYPEYMLRSKHEPFLSKTRERSGSSKNRGKYINLEEFLLSDESLYSAKLDLNNGQVRRIAGISDAHSMNSFGNLSRTTLDIAKQNLKDKIHVFGILEEYNKSLVLLRRYFQWGNVFYFKLNQSQKKMKAIHVDEELITEQGLELAKQLNSLDIELYNYAKDIFNEKVEQEDDSFQKELEWFKSFNPTLGATYSFVQSALRKIIN